MHVRKRPIVVEAEQFHAADYQVSPSPWNAVNYGWPKAEGDTAPHPLDGKYWVRTHSGPQIIEDGDWVMRGVEGELYPCKQSVFVATYDPVTTTPTNLFVSEAKLDKKFYGTLRKAKNDEIVPDDEWICFLAKDNAFAEILPLYRIACIRRGCDIEQIDAVTALLDRVTTWRLTHEARLKNPDAHGEKLLV